jgi:hypothetical protein
MKTVVIIVLHVEAEGKGQEAMSQGIGVLFLMDS